MFKQTTGVIMLEMILRNKNNFKIINFFKFLINETTIYFHYY